MPRAPRRDEPGMLHHVMHRAIARRTAFETRADVRYFLSRVAREVRRGELEVHAYSVMATHFHLLARSPRGRLSQAMRRILNSYVRYFNRSRKRDGSLFRCRFRSVPVESEAYRSTLYSYIDQNPVEAGITASADRFPRGSAWWYARTRGPVWMCRDWAEREVVALSGGRRYLPEHYPLRFPPLDSARRHWVERRLACRAPDEDELDDLVAASPAETRAWMVRKAALADGTRPGFPVVPAGPLLEEIRRQRGRGGPWQVASSRRHQNAWDLMAAGLLRDVGGLPWNEVALRLRAPPSTLRGRVASHRHFLQHDAAYRRSAARILRRTLGGLGGVRRAARALSTHARRTPPGTAATAPPPPSCRPVPLPTPARGRPARGRRGLRRGQPKRAGPASANPARMSYLAVSEPTR